MYYMPLHAGQDANAKLHSFWFRVTFKLGFPGPSPSLGTLYNCQLYSTLASKRNGREHSWCWCGGRPWPCHGVAVSDSELESLRPALVGQQLRGIWIQHCLFANAFEATWSGLNETIVTFSEDLIDSQAPGLSLSRTQQRAVLKIILSKNFQLEREINLKPIYDEEELEGPEPGSFVSQLCRNPRHLTDNAKKMVFWVYQAALPH